MKFTAPQNSTKRLSKDLKRAARLHIAAGQHTVDSGFSTCKLYVDLAQVVPLSHTFDAGEAVVPLRLWDGSPESDVVIFASMSSNGPGPGSRDDFRAALARGQQALARGQQALARGQQAVEDASVKQQQRQVYDCAQLLEQREAAIMEEALQHVRAQHARGTGKGDTSGYPLFFCSIIHTAADPCVAAPGFKRTRNGPCPPSLGRETFTWPCAQCGYDARLKKVGALACCLWPCGCVPPTRDAPLHSMNLLDSMVCIWYVLERFLYITLTGCPTALGEWGVGGRAC